MVRDLVASRDLFRRVASGATGVCVSAISSRRSIRDHEKPWYGGAFDYWFGYFPLSGDGTFPNIADKTIARKIQVFLAGRADRVGRLVRHESLVQHGLCYLRVFSWVGFCVWLRGEADARRSTIPSRCDSSWFAKRYRFIVCMNSKHAA